MPFCCPSDEVSILIEEHDELVGRSWSYKGSWAIPHAPGSPRNHFSIIDFGKHEKTGFRKETIFAPIKEKGNRFAQIVVMNYKKNIRRMMQTWAPTLASREHEITIQAFRGDLEHPKGIIVNSVDVSRIFDLDITGRSTLASPRGAREREPFEEGTPQAGEDEPRTPVVPQDGPPLNADVPPERSPEDIPVWVVISRKLFTLSMDPKNLSHSKKWSYNEDLINRLADQHRNGTISEEDRFKYGTGVVTEVVFGGMLLLEMSLKSFYELQRTFGIELEQKTSMRGIKMSLNIMKVKSEPIEFTARRYGGRLEKSAFTTDAMGVYTQLKSFDTNLERYPHECKPVLVTVSSYGRIQGRLSDGENAISWDDEHIGGVAM